MATREMHHEDEGIARTEKIRREKRGGQLDNAVKKLRVPRNRRRERTARVPTAANGGATLAEFVDETRLRATVEVPSTAPPAAEQPPEESEVTELRERARITDPSDPGYLSDAELTEMTDVLDAGETSGNTLPETHAAYRHIIADVRAARSSVQAEQPSLTPQRTETEPPKSFAGEYAHLSDKQLRQKRKELQDFLAGAAHGPRPLEEKDKPEVQARINALSQVLREKSTRRNPTRRADPEAATVAAPSHAHESAPDDFASEYAHLTERQLRQTRAALEQLVGDTPPAARPMREHDKPEVQARIEALSRLLAAKRAAQPRPVRTAAAPPQVPPARQTVLDALEPPLADTNVNDEEPIVEEAAHHPAETSATETPADAPDDRRGEIRPVRSDDAYASLSEDQLRKKQRELRRALETRFKKKDDNPKNREQRREVQQRLGAINRALAAHRVKPMSPADQDEAARAWLDRDESGLQTDNGMGGADELRHARDRLLRAAREPAAPVEHAPEPMTVAPEQDPDAQEIASLRADLTRLEDVIRTRKVHDIFGSTARQEDVEREMLAKEAQLRTAERRVKLREQEQMRTRQHREREERRTALEREQQQRSEDVRRLTANWERLRDGTEPVPDSGVILAEVNALRRLREEIRDAERAILSHTVQQQYDNATSEDAVHALIAGKESEVRRLEQSIQNQRVRERNHATAEAYARVRAAEQALADIQQRLAELDREQGTAGVSAAPETGTRTEPETPPDHAHADAEAAAALAREGNPDDAVAQALTDVLSGRPEPVPDEHASVHDPYWRSALRRQIMERIVDEGRGSPFLEAYVQALRANDPEYARAQEAAHAARDAQQDARRDSVRRIVRQLVPARAVMSTLLRGADSLRQHLRRTTEQAPATEHASGMEADGREVVTDGDTVSGLLAKQLMKRYGEQYLQLDAEPARNAAKQRFVLEAAGHEISAHPDRFGIRNGQGLQPGQTVDFSPLFAAYDIPALLKKAQQLSEQRIAALLPE